MDYALRIKGADVFINGHLQKKELVIKDGKIVKIEKQQSERICDEKILDCSGMIIIPGTIDPHVHLRDPGHRERETFFTGTMAAAAGGVTTIIEHPISVPPPYNKCIFENRIDSAKPQAIVDYCFVGALGTKSIGCAKELKDCGAVAYKTFLHDAMPGREAEFEGLTISDDYHLLKALETVKLLDMTAMFHAENNSIISGKINELREAGYLQPIAHYLSRPIIAEVETVSKLILFAKETGARIEICHVSSSETMELLKKAKEENISIIVETCPHYLFKTEEECISMGAMAKCNPPIRKRENVEKMWQYVQDGTVDIIGSDHGPFTYEQKIKGQSNIFEAPSGMPGLETRLPIMMDSVLRGKLLLEKMVQLLCENPAKIFGIDDRKGYITEGMDADLVVLNTNKTTTVDKNKMYTKSKDTADLFDGMILKGYLEMTIVRGKIVMKNGMVDKALAGYGMYIKRR